MKPRLAGPSVSPMVYDSSWCLGEPASEWERVERERLQRNAAYHAEREARNKRGQALEIQGLTERIESLEVREYVARECFAATLEALREARAELAWLNALLGDVLREARA